MGKRQSFYTRADLFEAKVSPRAKLVLAYLSRISDKQGVSYPSIPTIAEKCGCCPNSARKALRELEQGGFISMTAATIPTRSGKTRWTSNRYTLLFLPAQNEVPPLQPLQEGTSTDAGLSYDRVIKTDVPKGHSQSVEKTDRDRDHDGDERGLKAILSRLQLDLFEDKPFTRAVRHALKRMYNAESIRVKGERIPREQVRSAMELLSVDHIDFVYRQLREKTGAVTWGEGYLVACLYNAPLDCMARSRCG